MQLSKRADGELCFFFHFWLLLLWVWLCVFVRLIFVPAFLCEAIRGSFSITLVRDTERICKTNNSLRADNDKAESHKTQQI